MCARRRTTTTTTTTLRSGTSTLLGLMILLRLGFEIHAVEEESSSSITARQLSFRQYTCLEASDVATCELSFFKKPEDGWRRITMNVDDGCFVEMDPRTKQLYSFCPLQCPNATFAHITAIRPDTSSLPCRLGYSVDVIRRRHDWFLRRLFACWFNDVQVDISCAPPGEVEKATRPWEQAVRIRNRIAAAMSTVITTTSHDNSIDGEFLLTKRNEMKPEKVESVDENVGGSGEEAENDDDAESGASGIGSGEMP